MQKVLTGLIVFAITSPVLASSNFFAGASLGATENQTKSSFSGVAFGEDFNDSNTSNGNSTSYSIRGGYHFHKNLAVEIGYHEYGEVTYVADFDDSIRDAVETNSNNFGVKAIWPITDVISLGARAGIAKWNLDVNSTDSSLPDFSEDGTDVYYAAGIEYNISNRLSIGLEYSSLSMRFSFSETVEDLSYKSDNEHKVNSLSLTAQFVF